MTDQKNIEVDNIDDETRIDRWLKRRFSLLTQSFIENKLRRGLIKINNKKVKSNYQVLAGDIVNISNFSEKIFSKTIIIKTKKFIPKEIFSKFKDSIIYENFYPDPFAIRNKVLKQQFYPADYLQDTVMVEGMESDDVFEISKIGNFCGERTIRATNILPDADDYTKRFVKQHCNFSDNTKLETETYFTITLICISVITTKTSLLKKRNKEGV